MNIIIFLCLSCHNRMFNLCMICLVHKDRNVHGDDGILFKTM